MFHRKMIDNVTLFATCTLYSVAGGFVNLQYTKNILEIKIEFLKFNLLLVIYMYS